MSSSTAFKIVQDLYRKNRNFCSTDYDASLSYLDALLPLKIYSFTKKDEFNGWVIPPKWDLVEGIIKHEGKTIFKADHPLQVIGLSSAFKGTVSREELRKHLHYDVRDPESTPYHFRQNYRPWDRDWGFCVTKKFFDALPEGKFEVSIATEESPGILKVAEHIKKGSHPETFAFVAHLDHPGMANDDLAGVAVGIELFRRLQDIPTKFSYKLVIVQEIIGSVFYLGKAPETRNHVLESCFLEMLGTETQLAFQHSREAKARLEKAMLHALQGIPHRSGPFRSIICNDEIVWESYGIPMSSLSRFPYPQYHSDKDNPSIIKPEALEESIQILLKMIQTLDKETLVRKKCEGVLALSNPEYNLYVDPGQPAFGSVAPEKTQKLRLLMDLLPMFPNTYFVETIATETNLPTQDVLNYLQMWSQKGLLELI